MSPSPNSLWFPRHPDFPQTGLSRRKEGRKQNRCRSLDKRHIGFKPQQPDQREETGAGHSVKEAVEAGSVEVWLKGQPAAVKTVTPLTSVHQHFFVHVSLCLHLLLQYYLKQGSLSLCWNPNPTVAFFNFSTIKTTTRSLKTPGLDRGLNPRPGPQPRRLLDWSAL